VEALSAAALELARDPEGSRHLGRTARRRVKERFTLSAMGDGYISLLHHVLPRYSDDVSEARSRPAARNTAG
jgi:glycosyltransferase involved in cell wall biosynthesis